MFFGLARILPSVIESMAVVVAAIAGATMPIAQRLMRRRGMMRGWFRTPCQANWKTRRPILVRQLER